MYLSELFLDTIGNDFSKESLHHALTVCDTEYKSRKVSERELIDFYDAVIFSTLLMGYSINGNCSVCTERFAFEKR